MPYSDLLRQALRHFRSRRMRLFEKTFAISTSTRILDVGGSPAIWDFLTVRPRVTVLNFPSALERDTAQLDYVAANGLLLPFKKNAFDIVFSNSVVEHVGDRVQQQKFAEEIARVGRCYWVQTPNREFPIELHVMLPFIHYLPKTWQRGIVQRFTIWQLLARPSEQERAFYVNHFLNELTLLNASDLQQLFPEATILSERLLGLVKSNIAVRL
jgi:methyltransferase family protein